MSNTNQQKTFDNIKNVRDSVGAAAKQLQSNITQFKKQVSALNERIAKREEQLVAGAEAEVVTKTAPVQEPVIEKTEPVVKPVQEQPEKIVVEEKTAEEKVQKKAEVKNSETPAQPVEKPAEKQAEKPQGTVVTTVREGGLEVKTFTDEKGNVRVRKFLDTSYKKPQPQPQQQAQQKDSRMGGKDKPVRDNRGGKPNGQGASSQQRADRKPVMDKDKDQPTRQQGGASKPAAKKSFAPVVDIPRPSEQKSFGNKNKTHERSEEKRQPSKKSLITRNYTPDYDDEDKVVRRAKTKKTEAAKPVVTQKITHAVVSTQEVPIKLLSERIGVSVSEIIKQLFKESIFKTINDSIDFDYAAYIAGLYDVTLELKADKTADEMLDADDDGLVDDTPRPPIVTVMGHVDHGKTSLLDAIRNTNVTSTESGGITQHIGAYTVTAQGQQITFIDTPGHAAFTAMRARGAKITDVAIIVVAADDGVMPQTIEAINHAKAAEVSIVVAINKMDKPDINVDRVKQQLAELDLLCEEWGGDTIMVPVSAKKGMNIDKLLEAVLLVTEIKELKANPHKRATGTVLEAKLDKGRGPVATVLVSNGTLKVGDSVIAGFATGKIRAMFDDKGKRIRTAGPSIPVEVLGFSEVPQAGDFLHVADEKLVKKAAEERKNRQKIESARQSQTVTLGDLFGRISEGQLKTLNLIIKTDVQGSLEALKASLQKLSNDEVRVCPIHGGVGAVNETDIMLARASNAIIIGFNVRADANAKITAEREGVDVRLYNVIYDAVDDVTAAMKGMLAPKFRETVVGSIEVREVFKITGVGAVAGAYVTTGKAVRNGKVRIYRDDIKIYEGNILALKRFKDDVKEVAAGYECGVSVENYNDIKVGDVFEIYQMEEVKE